MRLFVSYNFNDRAVVHNFAQLDLPRSWETVFVNSGLTDPRELDQEIKETIRSCDAAAFVIGDNSHNSPWIERESQLATSFALPVLLLRLPNSTGAPPDLIKNMPLISWSSRDLQFALAQMEK